MTGKLSDMDRLNGEDIQTQYRNDEFTQEIICSVTGFSGLLWFRIVALGKVLIEMAQEFDTELFDTDLVIEVANVKVCLVQTLQQGMKCS